MTCCAGLPCATMSGIGGWSPGYQSAGPAPSRICAAVNDELLPGSLCIVGSGAGGVAGAAGAAGAAVAPGGGAKPYAHGGGTRVDCCLAARNPAPVTNAKKSGRTTTEFFIQN